MKSLTIEELKALEVGDWVWIVTPTNTGEYYQKFYESNDSSFVGASLHYGFDEPYKDYGTKWIAYKNKEQAEGGDEKIRKEVAQEILQKVYDNCNNLVADNSPDSIDFVDFARDTIVIELAKQYGVDVK